MTKERKIAIEMWEHIKDELKKEPLYHRQIILIKRSYLHKHGLEWESNCWFCQYLRQWADNPIFTRFPSRSYLCPLNPRRNDLTCRGYCPIYKQAIDHTNPLEVRLEACQKIIDALKGEFNARA